RLIFMHFQGRGQAVALAKTIRRAWDELGRPKPPELPAQGPAPTPDWEVVAKILGRPGTAAKDGTYKVTLPRSDLSLALDGQALPAGVRSEEHTSELQSQSNLVCRLLLEKKKKHTSS